jgi:hypothetical protein
MPKRVPSVVATALSKTDDITKQRRKARTTAGDDGLTPIERRFIEIVMSEDLTETEAYRRASGCKSDAGARVGVCRLKQRPEVQRAIVAAAGKTLGGATLVAAKRLAKLADSASSEYVQADAAKSILASAGLTTQQQPGQGAGGGISVTINLGRYSDTPDVVIDGHSARVDAK